MGGNRSGGVGAAEFKKYDSQAEAKRNVVAAIESVAKQLGNTPAICRKCYVHPEVLNAYMSGDLVKMIGPRSRRSSSASTPSSLPTRSWCWRFSASVSIL